jgi:hypothetical protein
LGEEDDTNCDETLMKISTSYLSPTRITAPTEPVPTTFAYILKEVELETSGEIGGGEFGGDQIGGNEFGESQIGGTGFGGYLFERVGKGGPHSGGS